MVLSSIGSEMPCIEFNEPRFSRLSRGRAFESCSSTENAGLFRLVPAELRLRICEALELQYGYLLAIALCITCKDVFGSLVPWLCSDRIIRRYVRMRRLRCTMVSTVCLAD